MVSGREETTAGTAATRPGPVQVELGYRRATFYAPPSLEEKIGLASRKPLGAYVARWFPGGLALGFARRPDRAEGGDGLRVRAGARRPSR